MRKQFTSFIAMLALLLTSLGVPVTAAAQEVSSYRVGGKFIASAYGNYRLKTVSAVAAGASSTFVAQDPATTLDPNASCLVGTSGLGSKKFTPLFVGASLRVSDGSSETVTVTGATNTAGSCSFTATFANAHNAGAVITSASGGLYEAGQDAFKAGGGVVVIDPNYLALGGTDAITAAAPVLSTVQIEDVTGPTRYWNPQGGVTTLAAPATLTAVTALPSATPVGAYGTGTYHMCIAYVDIMGQEGPCSADFSEAGLATGSFIFSAPAASTGAVGYTIYIGLTSGGVTNLNYKVPLTSTICSLTPLESITAACAVANTNYGQSGAAATVTAITVNTSPIQPAITTVSTTSIYVPNAGGRTTYAYVPSSKVGAAGFVTGYLPFTISAAEATTVPSVIGTMNVGPGVMNFAGATIEICGRATTTASTATIVHIQFQWDAFGQNTAGKGVVIGDLALTPVAAFSTTKVLSFCEQFVTTVAGASATAGSIIPAGGFLNTSGVSAAAAGQGGGADAASLGAVASLNLASEARINVISVHTTGTDGAALTLQSLTAKRIN